jgi:hypothetical protein
MRSKLESDEEFKKVIRRYKFNLLEDRGTRNASTTTQKLYLEAPVFTEITGKEEEEAEEDSSCCEQSSSSLADKQKMKNFYQHQFFYFLQ